ncbi:hypothetical protein GQ457_06G008160 [Hibiscus cannabinus]
MIRQVWVPKGTRDIEINVNGSKVIWIPKSNYLKVLYTLKNEHLKIVRLDQPNLTQVDSYAIINGGALITQVKGDE